MAESKEPTLAKASVDKQDIKYSSKDFASKQDVDGAPAVVIIPYLRKFIELFLRLLELKRKI